MKVGDLVVKRWGMLQLHQQKRAVAICLSTNACSGGILGTGRLIQVVYPGRKPELHSPREFEVVSEGGYQ
jgi:hypothetical protein|tara:strand:+ start:513 stop:722 length:210 start_codon:yes stop_codon:yes gene_type:complete